MEKACKVGDTEALSTCIFEVSREPAIVINGVPDVENFSSTSHVNLDSATDAESCCHKGFGRWLEGRNVRKLFGTSYYSGKVVKYDAETDWYRVIYEDNDFEDLDWDELKEVLQPLDIGIPLVELSARILKQSVYLKNFTSLNVRKLSWNLEKNGEQGNNGSIGNFQGDTKPRGRGRPRKMVNSNSMISPLNPGRAQRSNEPKGKTGKAKRGRRSGKIENIQQKSPLTIPVELTRDCNNELMKETEITL
ncbi:hypothetical protein AMTRI_Chr04g249010 [Amborella trichopoda]